MTDLIPYSLLDKKEFDDGNIFITGAPNISPKEMTEPTPFSVVKKNAF